MLVDSTLDKIIDHYGRDHQIEKAVEELGELSVAIAKKRGAEMLLQHDPHYRRDIIEEIADVKIVVAQLELIFFCRDEVEQMVDYKLRRTLEKMEG